MPLFDLNLAVVMSSLAQGKNNNPHLGQGELTGSGVSVVHCTQQRYQLRKAISPPLIFRCERKGPEGQCRQNLADLRLSTGFLSSLWTADRVAYPASVPLPAAPATELL